MEGSLKYLADQVVLLRVNLEAEIMLIKIAALVSDESRSIASTLTFEQQPPLDLERSARTWLQPRHHQQNSHGLAQVSDLAQQRCLTMLFLPDMASKRHK